MTYREALREAHRDALLRDPRVFVMGEDIGRYGGTYAVTLGLLEQFGPERIRDAPLSESAFVGAGVGAALGGMRPIVEVMTVNFSLLAMDPIVNVAATIRHMSGGQWSVPLVIRMATGAGRQVAAQHSHSFEHWFAHVPGLKVVAPATVHDARWMLAAALADPDPVLLFEHVGLYNSRERVDGETLSVALDGAAVRRAGADVTLITYGGSLPKVMKAAVDLAEEGIDAEVIDLRSLRPLDRDTIICSVLKSRRAVVVDETWFTYGVGAEVAASVVDGAFDRLLAPVVRLATAEVPIPYARHLEDAALPQPARIAEAARRVVKGG